ncbi:MAG: hypothetical protein AB1432_14120 [Bacteroidota bacterium]
MKKLLINIVSTIVIIFSLLSIWEGSRVLLGISVPDYKVFAPLLIYNVVMGFVGVVVGITIFIRHKYSIRYSSIVTLFHISTLITISLLYFNTSSVSAHSINAMIIRSALWLLTTISLLFSNRIFKRKNGRI